MPKIPVTQGRTVGVQAQGRPTLTGSAFGDTSGQQQIAKGIDDASKQLKIRSDKIKKEDDLNAVMEAETALGNWEMNTLNAPGTGYYSLNGENALGGTDRIGKDYDKQASEIRKNLKSHEQIQAFDKIYSQRRIATMTGVSRHEDSQRTALVAENSQAMQTMSMEQASNNYTDPQALQFNINNGIRAIMAEATVKGTSQETADLKAKNFVSEAHASVIGRMSQDSPAKAKEYFEANKHDMMSSARSAVEKSLKPRVVKEKARFKAEDIYAKDVDFEKKLKEAREIKDTEVSDLTISRLKMMKNEEDTFEAERIEEAWTKIDETFSLDDIPDNIPYADRKKMQSYITSIGTGEGIKTDLGYYARITEMTPKELANHNLDRTKLSPTDFKDFTKDKASASDSGDRPYSVKNVNTISNELLGAVNISKENNPQEHALFTQRLRTEVEHLQTQNGKDLTYSEVQSIGNRLLIERTKGFNKRAFKLDIEGVPSEYTDELFSVSQVRGMPVGDKDLKKLYDEVESNRAEIVQSLKMSGLDATYENIVLNYIDWLNSNGG